MKQMTLPRYVKIALDLARKIINGDIGVNEVLKGRTILAGDYNVSSETIRKAVSLLETEGIVEVRKGVGIYVIDPIKAEILVGKYRADRSVRQQEQDVIKLLAEREALDSKLHSCYRELLDSFKFRTTESINFYEVEILDGSKVIGQTIGQTQFWGNTGATIIAIVHDDAITVSPGPDAVLYANDFLIVVGDNEVVSRCEKFLDEGMSVEEVNKAR